MEPFGGKGDLSYGGAVNIALAKQAVHTLLSAFGLKVDSQDLTDTPRRVAEMYAELFAGLYHEPPKMTTFEQDASHDEVIALTDIFFTSVCSHHLAPFVGKAHIAYVPGKRLSGLSKLARIVDYYAARPQLQERMASQVADFVEKTLEPQGVAVVLTGSHGCVATRGANKSGSQMVTTVMRGLFANQESRQREDFLNLIGGGK